MSQLLLLGIPVNRTYLGDGKILYRDGNRVHTEGQEDGSIYRSPCD